MPLVNGGAEDVGGADLMLLLLLLVDVVFELDPDWNVVAELEVYPPSIAVLLPLVLVCVESPLAIKVVKIKPTVA